MTPPSREPATTVRVRSSVRPSAARVKEMAAALGVPLIKDGRRGGVRRGVQQATPGAWTPDDISLVRETGSPDKFIDYGKFNEICNTHST